MRFDHYYLLAEYLCLHLCRCRCYHLGPPALTPSVGAAALWQVESKQEVASGSEAEVELRAASIVAVELLKDAANTQLQQRQGQPPPPQQQQAEGCSSQQQQQQPAAEVPQLLSIQVSCNVQQFSLNSWFCL
jgi:hypothetical protein